MTISSILILIATLVLGGLIATLGDRIGTKIGKARLSLFKMRPRNTATFVTIVTGSLISASTLGLLFLAGLFELEQIQTNLKRARGDLATAQTRQALAKRDLDRIDQSLKEAINREGQTKTRLSQSQKRLGEIQKRFQNANRQLASVSRRATTLQRDIRQLSTDRQRLQGQLLSLQRDSAQLGRENAQLHQERSRLASDRDRLGRDNANLQASRQRLQGDRDRLDQQNQSLIAQNEAKAAQVRTSEAHLKEVETRLQQANQRFSTAKQELAFLEEAVRNLDKEFQELRSGSVALRRGQVLAAGLLRLPNPNLAQPALDRLLLEANNEASRLLQPGTAAKDLLRVTKEEVAQVIATIGDGQDYFVQILSGANYIIGDSQIRAAIEVTLNRLIFPKGQLVAATTFDPTSLRRSEIRDRLELVAAQAKFRARGAGLVTDAFRIEDVQALIRFAQWLETQPGSIEVRAITANEIYASGPLLITFEAARNGEVLYRMSER